MYGERSSERVNVNVRVALHIVYDKHFPIIVDVLLDRDVFVCLATGMGVTLLSRFCLGHLIRGGRKDNERSVVWKRLVLSPLSVALINESIN